MARTTNAIATEEDIEYAITNNLLLAKLALPEYTKRGITKERLVNIAYVDESSINSLSNKQLVRWDLIESGFVTTMPLSTTVSKNNATYTYKIASKYGWSASENVSWVSISPASSLSSGVKEFNVVVSQKTTSGTRSTTITFTESSTNKTIEISLTQNGTSTPDYQAITLYSGGPSEICDSTTSSTYYIEYGVGFFDATQLYIDSSGNIKAPATYYRQAIGGWRYWNGNTFTSSGIC